MITKFSTMYSGWVDMDNIGLDGMPVNDRLYPNEHLASTFDKAEAIARLMDESGYDTLWLAEHHFQPEGYECIPNLLMLSLHLAHLTKNLRFGCAFNIAPMWHPLRLAEDFATADILTNGRVIFGMGRGYHTREVETFGAPMLDADANRELFDEQVEVIVKAFNEESFSHRGKHYTIPPRVPYRGYELEEITLVPRPIHLPVEMWQPIVSGSSRGIDLMAKYGFKGSFNWSSIADRVIRSYKEASASYGRELQLGEDLCIGFFFHIDDSQEKAMRSAKAYFEENMKMFAPLGFVRGLSDEQIQSLAGSSAAATAGLPTIEAAVGARSWLCGTPEDLIASLKEFEEQYPGLEYVCVSPTMGSSTSVVLEQLGRFAEQVMPAFSPARVQSGDD